MIFRAVFLILATGALAGTAYVGYYGRGGESFDTQGPSVRAGSGGVVTGSRVK